MKIHTLTRLASLGPHTLDDDELTEFALGSSAQCASTIRRAFLKQDWRDCPQGVPRDLWHQLQCWETLRESWLEQHLRRTRLSEGVAVKRYLQSRLGRLQQEQVLALMLDNQLGLMESKIVALGTVNEAKVYPREIAAAALQCGAAAVILAHNHPSGLSQPSAADQALTEQLDTLLGGLGIRLVDHFVVTALGVQSIMRGNKAA